jgi:8-oxo-dGTP pyrophosphatase MutT (NUDIX family)
VYESEWVSVGLADVELPDSTRFEHHVVRGRPAAGVVVADPHRGMLLIWRHRFISDRWGWEIPAGRIDEGESAEKAAARETLEETGWRPGPLRPLCRFTPMSGVSDIWFNIFTAEGASHVGEPADAHEAERVEWVPVPEVRALIQRDEMPDGLSLAAVLWLLAFGVPR